MPVPLKVIRERRRRFPTHHIRRAPGINGSLLRGRWFARVHPSIVGSGGEIMGGTAGIVRALHFTGSGGLVMGGAATIVSRTLLSKLLDVERDTTVPSLNPSTVAITLPEAYG